MSSTLTDEERFIEEFGKDHKFFDGGEAEAQYVFRKLVATGWIKTPPLEGPPSEWSMEEKDKYWQGKLDEGWTNARIALEARRKPAGEFPGGESYHPTSQGVKPTSEALIESVGQWPEMAKKRSIEKFGYDIVGVDLEKLTEMMEEMANSTKEVLKTRQDNLYWEFNTETQKVDILWILETEDGEFYQKKKSINVFGGREGNVQKST